MPEIIFLVGLPGSGKTAYAKNLKKYSKYRNHVVYSINYYIETMAAIKQKAFHEIFDELYPEAENNFFTHLDVAVKKNEDIIIDRTNVSKEERKKIFNRIPSYYVKRAVWFNLSIEELKKMFLIREQKVITDEILTEEILTEIAARYEPPTNEEFDSIIRAYRFVGPI